MKRIATTFGFRSRLVLSVWLAAAMVPGAARAQLLTQAIVLYPGWNSVYLEVQPDDPTVGNVFADPAIASVWEPKVRPNTVAFIQNQNAAAFNRGGWAVYVPTNQVESLNNDLFAVTVNHPYIINVTGTNAVALNLTGRPAVRARAFQPDDFTLRGFAVQPKSGVTFGAFFSASPAHFQAGALTGVFRLDSASGQWLAVSPGEAMQRGAAYWVKTIGASTYFYIVKSSLTFRLA